MTPTKRIVSLAIAAMCFASTGSAQHLKNDPTAVLQRVETMTAAKVARVSSGTPTLILGTDKSTVGRITATSSVKDVAYLSAQYFRDLSVGAEFLPASAEITDDGGEAVGGTVTTNLYISYDGIPVRDRRANVTVGLANANLVALRNSLPTVEPNSTSPAKSVADVAQALNVRIPTGASITSAPSLVLVASDNNSSLRLAYECVIAKEVGAYAFRYTVDAMTGEIMEVKDLVLYCGPEASHEASHEALHNGGSSVSSAPAAPAETISGEVKANVLFHSPYKPDTTVILPYVKVTVNGKTTNADANGKFTVEDVSFPLTITSELDSRYFTVKRLDGVTNAKLSTTVASGVPALEWATTNGIAAERSAYSAAHRARAYVKQFNTTATQLDRRMTVNVNDPTGSCNAYYRNDNLSLNFYPKSGGCSNTAEIADVVYHEYGHHYHHSRFKEKAKSVVSGSLGEALADLVSNFMRDDPVIGYGFTNANSILRNSKNTATWPEAMSTDIHMNGLMLTGAVWDLRLKLGLAKTEKLFHDMLKYTPDAPNGSEDANAVRDCFVDVCLAFLMADDDDNNLTNGTPNSAAILSSFDKHNIGLPHLIDVVAREIKDQPQTVSSYPVTVAVSYNGNVGSLDEDSVMLHCSVDNSAYAVIKLSKQSAGQFGGSIPRVGAGSIVKYYATATNVIDGFGEARNPVGTGVKTFLVGFDTKSKNSGTSDAGFSYGISGDNASNGEWTRGEPVGSEFLDTPFELDADHSPDDALCFFTGYSTSPDPVDGAVVGGKSTLETGAIDLTGVKEPLLRVWYYFDARRNVAETTGSSSLKIQTSVNAGAYKSNLTVNDPTSGWQSLLIPITTANATSVKMRFIASAGSGMIVEAGVDDIEILSPQEQKSGVGSKTTGGFSLTTYPNPASSASMIHYRYELPKAAIVKAYLKDLSGETVWSSVGDLQQEGPQVGSISTELASGVYWLQLVAGDKIEYQRITITK